MSPHSTVFIQDEIHTQNIYSFSKFKKLRLAFFLRPDLKKHLLPSLSLEKKCEITFVKTTSDLQTLLETNKVDAVVIDMSGCISCGFECIEHICKKAGDSPVISIADIDDPDYVNKAFNRGIEDLIPKEEVTSKHLLRVISYAVVRSQNLAKVKAFEARHSGIVENATEGIFQTTPDGRYILANPALARLYGYETADELISDLTNIETQLYIDPKQRERFAKTMREKDEVLNFESQIRRKNGEVIWISENARAVRNEDGKIIYFEGFVRNITARKENENQLTYLAQRDPLTGLPNRALYQERLTKSIELAKTDQSKVGVLFIDLDNFKKINDTMGHPVGDLVLQKVASRLMSCTNTQDTVARLSGDEFTVILNDVRSPQIAAKVASRILDALSEPITIENKQVYASGSIGVSIYPDHGDTISELMQNVDAAAYHAKKMGRNSYQFYTENLNAQEIRRLEIENGLRKAVHKNELSLHYQAKVDLQSGQIIGSEALLRWENDILGNVSPDEFIPIAEETGLIIPIGEWVLQQACQQCRNWLDEGLDPGTIAVNLSARQFHKKGLFDVIKNILQTTGLPPERLELELTESALVEHVNEAINFLKEAETIGIKTSIDDFGTGYSSLSYLKKFPISTLKIDRSFIMDIPDDTEDMAITRAIISLGKSLDLKIVAEGIEDEAQISFLKKLGCNFGQGYKFSKPIDEDRFVQLLKAKEIYS
ncbi:Diguanylate cyclase/phosphodiesterase with PAS/PAC sensor(S) (modular protein) [Candidatus Terasakiella magnetica]|uniref:Diguanylate cyclase/phosphodiesterase with PAS/PAC sensor(S) (Modular protein) n=1 Tax=Candidatus Terasakiella magnetica TaxID=1867952 RepID=A0A1C3RFG0_9PROT|nr:EAL domain-containing protein [Candidatus Terasakiella magnetica]SCA55999.1 Diguanylate cyclase/phosphodiesterase with PAS/PAC sensor(S) (modular protein) [Candidatus Terasakiella magnetica]